MKYLAQTKDDQALSELFIEAQTSDRVYQERVEFLKVQAKKVKEESDANRKVWIKKLEAVARSRGYIEDSMTNPELHMNPDGQLFLMNPPGAQKQECNCPSCTIGRLFNG